MEKRSFQRFSRSTRPSFLIFSFSFSFHSSFLAGDIGQMKLPVGMKAVNFQQCNRITGTADSRMSDGHIYLICFEASRTRLLLPHFILLPLFAFPPSGAVDKIVLPEGMQSVNFSCCDGITGTAESGMSDVHIYLIRFGGQPHAFPHSSFSPFPSLRLSFRRRRRQARAPRRHAECVLPELQGHHRYG